MHLLLGELLLLSAVAIVALVAAMPRPLWLASLAGAVPFVVAQQLLARADLGRPAAMALLAANVLILWAALLVAQVLGSTRKVAAALHAATPPVDDVLHALAELCAQAEARGFEPSPEGVVWLGENQIAIYVHADGTRAELIQHPRFPPGFSLFTDLGEDGQVVSVPWGHGLEPDRIRVPGASFSELLDRHRAEVAARVERGASVTPARADDALAATIASDTDESARMLSTPWRNAAVVTLQQTPLRALVRR